MTSYLLYKVKVVYFFGVFLYSIQLGYWYYEFIVTENVHDQDPREICNKDQWS